MLRTHHERSMDELHSKQALDTFDTALHAIYSAPDPEQFPALVLPALIAATNSQCAGLCANALLPGDPFVAVAFAGNPTKVRWQQFPSAPYDDHPTARFTTTAAPTRAVRITDWFPNADALHATRHYQENLRPLGMEYELTLLLDTALSQRLGISVARAGTDYADAEVDLLSRLGPHIKRAFHHVQTLAQLRAASADPSEGRATAWREVDLTPRESEILRWIATGRTNTEIARLLGIRVSTVKTHTENLLRKLGVPTRAAAATALRNLPLPPTAESHSPA